MEKIKKVFGGINLTWPKVIIFAIIAGVYTAVMAMLPIARDTSFSDLAVTFEVWILFGFFIIMNSKSAKDSALKCFVFFLISQPLVYLVQDVVNMFIIKETQNSLFLTFYRNWITWTIATIIMGFFGYYMKKDKWWGLIILTPILLLLGEHLRRYMAETIFSFPRHVLTTIFCIVTLIIYPLVIFNNKKIRIAGTIISLLIIVVMAILAIINPYIYSTDLLLSGEKYQFDDTYKAYLSDSKYGDLKIIYEEPIDCYVVHVDFKKAGKTEFILESPSGEKQVFDLSIRRDKFERTEKEVAQKEDIQNINEQIDDTWKEENVSIRVKEDSITKTNAIITIEDKNEKPKSWGENFALQISAGDDTWEDLIAKESINWLAIAIEPNENGITEMNLNWTNIYGELNDGTYRVVKYNGLSILYSEPFIIK